MENPMEVNIMGQVFRLARLEEQNDREYWRGVNRQTIKRGLASDLSHIPNKGHRDMGTPTVAAWDFTKTRGVDPTPTCYPESVGFRK